MGKCMPGLNKRVSCHTSAPAEITVPCWNILVGQPCSDIKHNDGTLSMYTASQEHNAEQSKSKAKFQP